MPHYLTPNSFLIGRIETQLVPSTDNPPETKLGLRWRQLESMSNQLWHRYIKEILPELGSRQKWKSIFQNINVNTVVLVVEPGLPRGLWKMGLVEKVELGRDGFVRSAQIRIGNKSYDRPITKLIPLTD
jgi:Family of unknown function (DUF5641)